MDTFISFSGGAGSFAAAVLTLQSNQQAVTIFCDTLIEDSDLYRFLLDSAIHFYPRLVSDDLKFLCQHVPPVEDLRRVEWLKAARALFNTEFSGAFYWLADGRDPWQVYHDRRYVGNTRTAHCSYELKARVFKDWIKANTRGVKRLVFGFDWAEAHRHTEAVGNWTPHVVVSPLCDPPYYNRAQILAFIDDAEIELPQLYRDGFTHNNCGGFCCQAGKKQFARLLQQRPATFFYHAAKQDEIHKAIPTTRPFLRSLVKGVQHYVTLSDFAADKGIRDATAEGSPCGCFSSGAAQLRDVTLDAQTETHKDLF